MKGIKGLVFDCDGVLFESRTANLAYYNTVLHLLSEAPVEESDHIRAHICHTAASPQVFMQLLGEERTAEALAVAAGLDYRQFIPYMTPEPGIMEVLKQLDGSYPLAVATNRGYSMSSILEHFGLSDFFQAVVTSRDVVHPKPAPDMLYEAARRLQQEPHELLFIGDSELDQAASRLAGMPFAIYRGDLQADVRLEHHGELLGIFVKDVVCGTQTTVL